MEPDGSSLSEIDSPLESFLRDYAEVSGGLWDEVEPKVYDLMLPPGAIGDVAATEVVRVTFDPEALPEHPGAQLASFGTPLVDRLLADAVARGRHAQLYLVGLNVTPQDLSGRAGRALTLPQGYGLRIERTRVLSFPQAVFWFEATFVSDQKEQELLPVAIDMHHGRQVRHLERLLDRTHLSSAPWTPLPEARHAGLAAAYPIARDRVVRTLAALANTRARELDERLVRQVERMRRYYHDLRAEVEEQAERARNRNDDDAKFTGRREALEREELLRVSELRQKSTLRVRLRLNTVLQVYQPKLLIHASASANASPTRPVAHPLELVWDPLTEGLEAITCPECGHPTYVLGLDRRGHLVCSDCEAKSRTAGKLPRSPRHPT